MDEAKFKLDQIVITSGASEALSSKDIQVALVRHVTGDWGDLDEEDKKSNDQALIDGNRLLSSYKGENGTKFWIITEWDRSVTTILLPSEY
jgi:hypothetical protein